MKYGILLFVTSHLCWSGEYVFYVRDLRDSPIPNLAVEAKGGNQSLTDVNGKLVLTIKKAPGSALELVINGNGYGWIAPDTSPRWFLMNSMFSQVLGSW